MRCISCSEKIALVYLFIIFCVLDDFISNSPWSSSLLFSPIQCNQESHINFVTFRFIE
jgi:LPS O-antigen subunit length determinant protein (WzzB/FepE family)